MPYSSSWFLPCIWVFSTLCAIHLGPVPISIADYQTLFHTVWEIATSPSAQNFDHLWEGNTYILAYLRLPQALSAGAIGAALGLAGALAQGLFRNPLADPGVLGVSSGAAASVAICLVFISGTGVWMASTPFLSLWFIPLAAFLGGLATCWLLDQIARWMSGYSVAGLLLTGIALNALLGAVIGLSSFLATDTQLRNLSIWSLGSLSGTTWTITGILFVLVCYSRWAIHRVLYQMNALALGEDVAQHVGIRVASVRRMVLIHVALLSAISVAFAGLIGFIGLVAPHIARFLSGQDHRTSAPAAMWMGAILLIWADIAARMVAPPALLPVGIFTALLGGPFFFALLWKAHHKGQL